MKRIRDGALRMKPYLGSNPTRIGFRMVAFPTVPTQSGKTGTSRSIPMGWEIDSHHGYYQGTIPPELG